MAPFELDPSCQDFENNKTSKKMSEYTSDFNKNDIIIANQISNESLLSKTDILESQMASKRALPPKFNPSGNPFMPIKPKSKKT